MTQPENKAFTAFIEILEVWPIASVLLEKLVFVHWENDKLWCKQIMINCNVSFRINGYCIFEKNGQIIPFAEIAHHTET